MDQEDPRLPVWGGHRPGARSPRKSSPFQSSRPWYNQLDVPDRFFLYLEQPGSHEYEPNAVRAPRHKFTGAAVVDGL